MGKPDALDRLAQLLVVAAAAIALTNGGFMIVAPLRWYQFLPTVALTGPPNVHFVRDIGLAYVSSGMLLAFAAVHLSMRWLAAVAGALWLSLHGVLHIWEAAAGHASAATFRSDALEVLGPPLLVWVAVGILGARLRIAPAGAPDGLFLAVADRMFPDDSAYLRTVASAPGRALEKFKHFMPSTIHRHDAPADLFHTARIAAVLVEDCGPCALTAAAGAVSDGVDRALVNTLLASAPPAGELETAFSFGRAIAQQDAAAFELGHAIEQRYGRVVRLELAFTAATVRVFPALKRGLGLSRSCALTKLAV